MRAPMALELRVRDTLEPRADFLRRVLSLSSGALGKLIVRHPQVGRAASWAARAAHSTAARALCASGGRSAAIQVPEGLQAVCSVVASAAALFMCALPARPQVLTCTEDMMQQRVDFLLQQGLSQAELGRAVLAHPQVGRGAGLDVRLNAGRSAHHARQGLAHDDPTP